MVRILAAGDFHGDRTTAKNLAQKAIDEKADFIVLNGDIVEEHDTDGVLYHFVKTGKPVFLVPGNHDWFATDFLAAKYKVRNLHATSVQYGNLAILGCGGANELTEKEIYETIKSTNLKVQDAQKRLLVAHVHPAGTKMESFSQFVRGSTGLRKAIETTKPDVVLCGHVHEAEGIEEKIGNTLIVNVGKKGKIIDF